jgi:N-acetylneuraminic acid mutarotase
MSPLHFLALSLCAVIAHGWTGILFDGGDKGKTQVYIPRSGRAQSVSFNLPSRQEQTAVTFNGKVYIIGGRNSENNFSNALTIFDPSTNQTVQGRPMSFPRASATAVVVNNTIIVCGRSLNALSPYMPCEQYDPSTQIWRILPTPPDVSRMSAAAFVLSGQMYIAGGAVINGQNIDMSSVFVYDGTQWTLRARMPIGLIRHAAIALDADRALICGGQLINNRATGNCSVYTASTDDWAPEAPLMIARFGHSMVLWQGWLLRL